MAKIYVIKNDINDCIYIGQTNGTLESRMIHHKSNIKTGNTLLYKAMRDIGFEHFSIHLIEDLGDVSQEIVDSEELHWILEYRDTHELYNTKMSKGKCGGDTLSQHPERERIGLSISRKVSGGNNSQATKVASVNLITGEEVVFNSLSECQIALGIPRHDIISRRCRNIINKPYNDYTFRYVD